MRATIIATALSLGSLLGACDDDPEPVFTAQELQDPNVCLSCHPKHNEQWSGSMHAYAAVDPVFRAMHQRGQRETNGELGMLCVNCHAPMAVKNGTITPDNVRDFDFATLAPAEDGVTCYFCHNVKEVAGDHNNPLVLAMDQTMRAGLRDPVFTPAHRTEYSELIDNNVASSSSDLCGSCHDIVNGRGVETERTFREWKTTVFATNPPQGRVSCASCHMEPSTGVVADAPDLSVPLRDLGFHNHEFPAIDQALVPFPQTERQDQAVKEFLSNTVAIVGPKPRVGSPPGGVCVLPNGSITVRVDAITVGHNFPSGSSFDRRAWVEVVAYDAANNVVFQSGVVPTGTDPEEIADPKLKGFWDRATKEDGSVAHFIWDVAAIAPNVVPATANVLMPAVTVDQNDPLFDHSQTATYTNVPTAMIDRVEAKVHIRAFAYSALRDLVDSGDLDPALLDKVQTLEVDTATWTRATRDTTTGCNPRG